MLRASCAALAAALAAASVDDYVRGAAEYDSAGVNPATGAAAPVDVDALFDAMLAGAPAPLRRKLKATPPPPAEEEEEEEVAAEEEAPAGAGGARAPPRAEPPSWSRLATEDALPAEPQSDAEMAFLLPPGRVIEFPAGVSPRSLSFAPTLGGLLVADAEPHGDARGFRPAPTGWLATARAAVWPGPAEPYPSAYLVTQRGALLRNLEFPEASALPLGFAEATDGRVGITFPLGAPGIEVWENTLDMKMTFHDVGVRPALPVFDGDGLFWVPASFGERAAALGGAATALWAYRADGSLWERFARRQLARVALPHSVHLDALGRVALAGLTEWPYVDGAYGRELREGAGSGAGLTALDFYELSSDAGSRAGRAELAARWEAAHGRAPASADELADAAAVPIGAVLALLESYDFPHGACLEPLFALMGDGHAVTACTGGARIKVLRYGDRMTGGAAAAADARARDAAAAVLDGKRPREAAAPNGAVRLRARAQSLVVADFDAPWGLRSIAGLAADPAGGAFAVADAATRRVTSVPWPLPGLRGDAPPPAAPITAAPPLPAEKVFRVEHIPRST